VARYRLTVEYDGAAFEGFQLQPGRRTVQGVLEAALETVLGHAARVFPAGRTDSGVHARGQVVRFDTAAPIDPRRLQNALNGLCGGDVVCVDAALAPDDFDPRRWPHTKQYVYRWLVRPAPSPLRGRMMWHLRSPLDVAGMQSAAQRVVGTHDFSSFRAAKCSAKHPVRTVDRCEVAVFGDEVHLIVEGSGFLRHMIRILAGTLTEVGKGARPPEWIANVLAARHRTAAARTAPAAGLTLEWIRYREAWDSLPSPSDDDDDC
jgi:tRNA pseudouridine38-40 synthase